MVRVLIVGNVADDHFSEAVAGWFGQTVEPSRALVLKNFANGEFIPSFISEECDEASVGDRLRHTTVVVVSVDSLGYCRQILAQRAYFIARGAKDNGAQRVILVEPELFYSAQDRGPRPEHGRSATTQSVSDRKRFDGQPFSARLHAQLLKAAGVDMVLTVHNHSQSVKAVYREVFEGSFIDLAPAELFAHYLVASDVVDPGPAGERLILCAPDRGAAGFVNTMSRALGLPRSRICQLYKKRFGERDVAIDVAEDSPASLGDLHGKDVVVFDDMVRTGTTIMEACQVLRRGRPRRIVLCVSHFYASEEACKNLGSPVLDEIVALNTLPAGGRATQGPLGRKLVVLGVERWIAQHLHQILGSTMRTQTSELYSVTMSSENPRWNAAHR